MFKVNEFLIKITKGKKEKEKERTRKEFPTRLLLKREEFLRCVVKNVFRELRRCAEATQSSYVDSEDRGDERTVCID